MTPFDSILAATDFSIDGDNAVRRAALLAREQGARLHIVHVLKTAGRSALAGRFAPPTAAEFRAAQARAMLRRLAVEIAAGYDVAAHVELPSGDPVETLGRISQRAQLLVLGARGGGGFGAWRVGRTVRRVLDAGRCPVLVVKTPVHSPYRRVLVPVDFDAGADAALLAAARIAGGASIQVFHAIDSQREAVLRDADVPEHVVRESRLTEEAGVAARIRRKVAGLGLDPRRFGFAVAHGPAVRSTLRQALAIGADLVVAGTRGRAGAGRLFARSVGRRVLSRVGCDMLTVAQAPDEARSAAARLGGRAAPPAAAAFAGATVRAESAQDAAALPPAWSTR